MTRKQILLVDDELMLLMSMQRMLDAEYDITLASSGQEAIDLINKKDKTFDLVICDVSMPNINGPSFYLYILQNYPELEKKIIFMTGGPMSDYLDEFFLNNKKLCLKKPFDQDNLLQIIKEVLNVS